VRIVKEVFTLPTLEFLKALQITTDNLQNKINFAIEHMAFAHLRQRSHMILELSQSFFRLALQADHSKHSNCKAQLCAVKVSMITPDHAGIFQRADSAQAGRRSQTDPLSQLDIGHPPFFLQFGQQPPVDLIEIRHQQPQVC
jgi:hypothetical protein